jgi:hypothetical protein
MRYYAILFIVLCFIVFIIVILVNNNNNGGLDENATDFHKINETLNNKLSGFTMSDINCINLEKDTIKLSDLVNGRTVLVFHYSALNCNTCYEEELQFLKKYYNTGNKIFIILASYTTYRNFQIYVKNNISELPVYQIGRNTLDWDAEKYGTPYYFVLYPNMSVSDFFILNNLFPQAKKQYFEKIQKNILK